MEKKNSHGLFLKNYLGTVSAVPRPRPAVHMESRSPYAHSASIDIQNCLKHLTEDDTFLHNSYEGNKTVENGLKSNQREELLNEFNKQRSTNAIHSDLSRIINEDDDKDKKKEKKWTLGGFFRRKCRKDADDSSEESDDGRKGFLSRRKSKRDRRKSRTKNTANGFDVIIPPQKDTTSVNGIGKTVEELWGNGDVKTAPVRYIYRHPYNGSTEMTKAKDTLQVPRHSRRDSNLSRNSSGGSGSLEGRKGRKEVLARAEAKRDQMRDESSSDENESYHSSSSLNRVTTDGRRRRHKRLSRDEECSIMKNGDVRVVKSDLEGSRLPHHRWISKGCHPDSSDHENLKLSLLNHSATPSPARSPRVRQKQLMSNVQSLPIPNSYPVNTFPPGIHYPHGRNVPNYNGLYQSPKYIQTKDIQVHNSQPLLNVNFRKGNRNSDYIQPPRRSTSEHSTNRRTIMDYERFLSSCGTNKEKSISYDHDIHRASYIDNNPSDVAQIQYTTGKMVGMHLEAYGDGRKRDPSPRDLRRIPINSYYDLPQRKSKCKETDGENIPMVGSLPIHYPNYPTVQRSASGNSFCNVYENTVEAKYKQIRSNSYQHIPSCVTQQNRAKASVIYTQNGVKNPILRTETVMASPAIVQSDSKDKLHQISSKTESLPKPQTNNSVSNLRYYADQNPRSRNPIHITCNSSPTQEQTFDPLVIRSHQSSVKEAITNASDFWKLKDQENLRNLQLKKTGTNANTCLKPPLTHLNVKTERSRSDSPKGKLVNGESKPKKDEDQEKLSKEGKMEVQTKPTNLDDALIELESIYNSLRLGDEDQTAVVDKRELTVSNQCGRTNPPVRERAYDVYPTHDHHKTAVQRRSGIPDKVSDDMAYRRMNSKDRTENKKFPPHSYLRSSPALSPVLGENPNLIPKESSNEPDVTFDDVVFRNIRHANSTLKIQDPQPPFGIPIGPIAPAANSDYLHATPTERFRPTFMSSKVPDVVKDDLAFRNLRKDNMTTNLPVIEHSDSNKISKNNYILQKKRAVRSLSANLYNLIQREKVDHSHIENNNNNNNILAKDSEKTQSLTDLSEQEEKRTLEKRLKELKEEKNAKRAEFFEFAKEQRKKRNSKSKLSWTELAHLNSDFEVVPQSDTSTETLTEDKENNKSLQQRLRVNFSSEETNRVSQTPEKTYRSPVVALSKYPAAAPSSTLYSNPFREPNPGSPLDEAQLEDLLSALEKEAKSASEDLGRQLVELELSVKDEVSEENKRKSLSIPSGRTEETVKYSSLERIKTRRSRNSSISMAEKDVESEEKPTEILDKLCSDIASELPKEVKSDEEVGKLTNEIMQITEELIRRESKDRKQNPVGFEVVTDLSEILHDMEEQSVKPKDMFQEVYEYNIGLEKETGPVEIEEDVKDVVTETKDIELEFEKLHMEVDTRAEEEDRDDAVVKELIADITSGSGSRSESYSSRSFPNEVSSENVGLRCRDGSSPGSSNGEGFGHA